MDGTYAIGNHIFCERCNIELQHAECDDCDGKGWWVDENREFDDFDMDIPCPACEGSGYDPNSALQCWGCHRCWEVESVIEWSEVLEIDE